MPLAHGSILAHRPEFTQRWERGSFTISEIEGIVQSIHRAKQSPGTLLIPTRSFSLRVVGVSHPRFHLGQIYNHPHAAASKPSKLTIAKERMVSLATIIIHSDSANCQSPCSFFQTTNSTPTRASQPVLSASPSPKQGLAWSSLLKFSKHTHLHPVVPRNFSRLKNYLSYSPST
jgi:hypothetical protein